MEKKKVELKAKDIVKEITVDVEITGQRTAGIRLIVGSMLLRFAAWIIGCDVVFKIGDKK